MKNSILLYLLLICSFQSFSQVNLNAGLMAYYPFSGNAKDASGNGNNPVFNNATLISDRFGNPNSAYSFNGTDNYIRIPNSPSLNSSNQISICAWVKVAGFYQGTCHGNNIVMKGDADFQPGDYKIRFDDAYITNNQNCFNNTTDVTHETFFGINATLSSNSPFIQTGQWYSVVYTNDGTTAKIYVNCQLAGEGPSNGLTFTNGDDLFLGSLNNAQYPYWFNGIMDEVRIYNRALNEDEIKQYGDCSTSTLTCSNWLKTPSVPSSVRVGQINITGNQLTVEALINRTAPYSGGQVWAGDVVSKHRDPTDANYILRPNSGEITTSNGYYKTPDIADIDLNKSYHIAMVYDGDSLKFYRDGCLMSQIAASGNLIQNQWETSIGFFSPEIDANENFIGYINEVRIWNVVRTQDQLRSYMNSSLLNPTTQPGLLAYYTFENLINKQGNPAWNGTINGSATINETNPNCNPIEIPCLPLPVNCNTWLKTPSHPSYVQIGQLNVAGNQITVEAAINRSSATPDNPIYNGDIVSKHNTPADVNYLLRSFRAEITTTNGFFTTPWAPDIEPNKTYHVAFTYDGKKLKFYRDGCLLGETDATGDLIQNSWNTRIGDYEPEYNNENFIGYINEVRIWNVARTQQQIQTYMNSSLPDPTKQPGLLAYYTFDDLTNKQGNVAYNGILGGSASIKETNPACAAIVSQCCDLQVTKSNDTTICANSKVQFLATGGMHYSWTPANTLNDATIANPIASPTITTKYYVTVSNDDGCSKKDSVTITVNSLPVISKSNDTSICVNTKAFLVAKGGSSYSWTPANSLDNANIYNPVASPSSNTTYTVKVTDNNSCSQTAAVNVNINPVSNVAISNDTSICKNTSVKLLASGGNTYSWSPAVSLNNSNSPSPVATPAQTTLYYVSIKDQYSCFYKDSIKVSILPDAVFSVSPDSSVCENDAVQLSASGGDSYTWTPASFLDNPNVNNPVSTADSSMVYSVSIKENTCNQSAILTTRINILPKPEVHATKSNEIDCFSSSTQLSASGANEFLWTPSSGLNNSEIANPTATPQTTTVYTVTGKDVNGCTGSDTVSVKVNFDRNVFFGLPNSFTPNGDGLNDCFGVSNWGTVTHLELSVYNRFGQRIFYTNNPAVCWDGTFHGKQQNADVYVYTIKATMSCGEIDKKGTVTLLR